MKSSWHVATAAEAIAAAQFARCGWDVSVQYGANQPEYDLAVINGSQTLKVSVKGSKDGAWGLTQSFIKNADYQGAIDVWLGRHKPKTVLCFVQFMNVRFAALPRLYLATPLEVAERLRASAAGRGNTILDERKEWTERSQARGTIDSIPPAWLFTEQRLAELAHQLA